MRDIIYIYMDGLRLAQATLCGEMAARFERGLGDRLIGKVVLEAK